MTVKKEFNQTMAAVEHVLAQGQTDPREIRACIKQLVTAYQAKDVVSQAFKNYADSGVMQWKTFLRAANVKQDEPLGEYLERIKMNLQEMKRFDATYLKDMAPAMARP
jgi:DUF971 family protein